MEGLSKRQSGTSPAQNGEASPAPPLAILPDSRSRPSQRGPLAAERCPSDRQLWRSDSLPIGDPWAFDFRGALLVYGLAPQFQMMRTELPSGNRPRITFGASTPHGVAQFADFWIELIDSAGSWPS